jgi:hypothetical protein
MTLGSRADTQEIQQVEIVARGHAAFHWGAACDSRPHNRRFRELFPEVGPQLSGASQERLFRIQKNLTNPHRC